MKIYLLIIIIFCFLQASFVGVNLCLILLVARSFLADDKSNLYMGFLAGIFLGVLTTENMGFIALSFLLSIKFMNLLKRLPISENSLIVIPYSLLVITLFNFTFSFINKETLNFSLIIIETILVLPTYLILRTWEDNFTFQKDIKLKY
jgi:hypothetical protein